MKNERPLWHCLYYNECYAEVCRAIGYGRYKKPDAEDRLAQLFDRFGKEKVIAASREILAVLGTEADAEVCLKDEVRKACFMLLGPPPEHPLFGTLREGPPLPRSREKPPEPQPEPKPAPRKRTRGKP